MTVPAFTPAKVVFTAPESGTLTVSSTSSSGFAVYSPYQEDKEYSMDPDVDPTYPISYLSYFPWKISLEVEAGQTYLFLERYGALSEATVTATMGTEVPSVSSISPAPGSVMPITGSVQFEAQFKNNTVNAEKCVVSCGSLSSELAVNSYNGYLIVDYASTVYDWLMEDQISPNDDVTLTISGITLNDKLVASAKYGETEIVKDGVMAVSYKTPEKPVVFVSCSKEDNTNFMSYYAPNDESGIFTYTFSGPVQLAEGNVIWRFGSTEIDGNGYADGTIPFSVDGNKIHVNATGVVRNMSELAPAAVSANMSTIYLYLYQVRDMQGNYIYSPNQGVIGTVMSTFNYKPLPRIDVLSDFEPVSGSNIDGLNEIKIWVNPIDQIEFSGVNFAYTQDNSTYNVRTSYTVDPSATDSEGFTPITAAIPDEVRGKGTITVTLADLTANDGQDHESDVKATFTSTTGVFHVTADNREADGTNPELQAFTANFTQGIKLATLDTPAVITLSNMDREVVASLTVSPSTVTVADGTAKFSLDKKVSEDGRYILMIPAGTFLLGEYETPNDLYVNSYDVEVPNSAIINGIKITPNPNRTQEALTTVVMEWTEQAAVTPNFDMTGVSAVYDQEGNKVSALEFGYGVNERELNIYVLTPVRTSGIYTLKFPAGQFLYGHQSDVSSEAIEFTYTVEASSEVKNPWDTVTYDPSPETERTSISTFLLKWPECESAGVSNDWVDVKLPVRNQAGSEATQVAVGIDYDIPDWNVLRATLDNEITTPGSYTIVFPAGYFTFNDDEANVNKEFSVTYTIPGAVTPGADYTFEPDPANPVEKLESFDIFFNKHTSAGPNGQDGTVTDDKGTKTGDAKVDFDLDDERLNKLVIILNPALTESGTYTITFPVGSFTFDDDDTNVNEEPVVVTYIVDAVEGVSIAITDETIVKVYDLEGRMVREGKGASLLQGLRGIYIVNGVKTILK